MTEIETEIKGRIAKMAGWCAPEKAMAIYNAVRETRPNIGVEIGVFEGKSLLAAAFGMRDNGGGVVFGVDSWDAKDCAEDAAESDRKWWTEDVNLERHYEACQKHIADAGLSEFARLLRTTSEAAAPNFKQPISYLHIDGNHSMWASCRDVILWLPKLSVGSVLVMDDYNWETVKPSVELAKRKCDLLHVINRNESVSAFFRKVRK